MRAIHYLPILTTILSALFALSLFRRWQARRSPHLWWWAFGILTYGAGTAVESDPGVPRGSVHVTTPQGLLVRDLDEALRAIGERLHAEAHA